MELKIIPTAVGDRFDVMLDKEFVIQNITFGESTVLGMGVINVMTVMGYTRDVVELPTGETRIKFTLKTSAPPPDAF